MEFFYEEAQLLPLCERIDDALQQLPIRTAQMANDGSTLETRLAGDFLRLLLIKTNP